MTEQTKKEKPWIGNIYKHERWDEDGEKFICIPYADLMTDLYNRRVIGVDHFNQVLDLRNATLKVNGRQPLLMPGIYVDRNDTWLTNEHYGIVD